jgi:photosystem II stability/assembly factor-like uncharacterized protein
MYVGYAVGEGGAILRTTDSGEHWTTLSSGVSVPLYSISLLDTNHGTTVGAAGTILQTSDGGISWKRQLSPSVADLHGVALLDNYKGFIAGSGGTMLNTTNGGRADTFFVEIRPGWHKDSTDTQNDLHDVAFPDDNVGFAVGRAGTIVRSLDGGVRWNSLASGTINDLYGVYFFDANVGLAVGRNGTIVRTSDRGASWSQQIVGTTEDLYGVSFSDAESGVVVGTNGTIFRTTDGGYTWFSQPSGTTTTLRGVVVTDENPLLAGIGIDRPPRRIVPRGMSVEIISPFFTSYKGVYQTQANFQPSNENVFTTPNSGGNYMVVAKQFADIDTLRGGSASDTDIEFRFNGDSSWALFHGSNVPSSRWVRVPYTVWAVGVRGRDSINKQFYSVIHDYGGDSIWRPQLFTGGQFNGKSFKAFYPISVVVDSFRLTAGIIGNVYDDSIPYRPEPAREMRKFLWGLTQDRSVSNALWKAYIADLDDDGIAIPRGTTIRFARYHYVRDRDEKLFTGTAVQRTNLDAARREIEKINVFPNPYYGMNRAEVNKFQRFVRFNHLPFSATIRIFNLAGILVRTIRKEDDTQFVDWDLNNERGLPAASGVLLAYLELKDKNGVDLGTKNLKLMIVQETRAGN